MKKPRDVGLYNWRQVRYESAVTYTAGVIVGSLVALFGVAFGVRTFDMMRAEQQMWGGASFHVGNWLTVAALIAIGVFWAHAGIIFWWRRLVRRPR